MEGFLVVGALVIIGVVIHHFGLKTVEANLKAELAKIEAKLGVGVAAPVAPVPVVPPTAP